MKNCKSKYFYISCGPLISISFYLIVLSYYFYIYTVSFLSNEISGFNDIFRQMPNKKSSPRQMGSVTEDDFDVKLSHRSTHYTSHFGLNCHIDQLILIAMLCYYRHFIIFTFCEIEKMFKVRFISYSINKIINY